MTVTTLAAPIVLRFGALGDMILLTPLLHRLHRRYGRPCRVVGSGAWLAPLFAGHPDVESVWPLRSRKRPYWLDRSQQRLVAALRGETRAPVYVCDDYALDKIRWLLDRAGVAPERRAFANPDCLLGDAEHWIERWLRFATMTPDAFVTRVPEGCVDDVLHAPRLIVSDVDRADLDTWLHARGFAVAPLLLVQPGNKRTLKRGRAGQLGDDKFWPPERWAALLRALATGHADAHILLCGVPAEQPMLRTLAQSTHCGRVHAVGDALPLRRLLALCERAAGMISVDTGPAHAAAALGCPLVVMYGAGRPAQWLPRSPARSPVIALGGPPQRTRVAAIGLDEVLAAWNALPLRAAPAAR